jgi:hypothetical protein
MNEQEETDRAADDDLILSAASMGLDTTEVLLPAQYEAKADLFVEKLSRLLKEAGQAASIDEFLIDIIRDTYRNMIDLRDQVRGNYTEEGKFGEKEHHLFKSYQTERAAFNKYLAQVGATPMSRINKGLSGYNDKAGAVPHGNAKSNSIMDIINE